MEDFSYIFLLLFEFLSLIIFVSFKTDNTNF